MTFLYLTPSELQRAITGQEWSQVFPEGVSVDDGLADLCTRVSTTVDNIVQREVMSAANRPYVLRASTDTEIAVSSDRLKLLVDKNGRLNFRATYRPIREIKSFEWAALPSNMGASPSWKTIDPTTIYVTDRDVIAVGYWNPYDTLQGKLTYVNGFANGLLTVTGNVNDQSITVDDPGGYYAGDWITIYGVAPEVVEIKSDYVTGTNPVTLAAGLTMKHPIGTRASALQMDVQQGAIFLAMDLVQKSGASGFVPASIVQLGGGEINVKFVNFYNEAVKRLEPYIMTQ